MQRNFKIKKRIEFLNLLYGNLGEVFLRHGHMSWIVQDCNSRPLEGILRWSGIQFSLRNPKVITMSETKENKGQWIIRKSLKVCVFFNSYEVKKKKMNEAGKKNYYYYCCCFCYCLLHFEPQSCARQTHVLCNIYIIIFISQWWWLRFRERLTNVIC